MLGIMDISYSFSKMAVSRCKQPCLVAISRTRKARHHLDYLFINNSSSGGSFFFIPHLRGLLQILGRSYIRFDQTEELIDYIFPKYVSSHLLDYFP